MAKDMDSYLNTKSIQYHLRNVLRIIGPWTVQVCGNPYEFEALTVIDTVTNLVELVRIDDKRSQTVARKFTQCWLTHYPWPQHCVHNPGTEFTGPEFQTLL